MFVHETNLWHIQYVLFSLFGSSVQWGITLRQWASLQNPRALKLKQLIGPSAIIHFIIYARAYDVMANSPFGQVTDLWHSWDIVFTRMGHTWGHSDLDHWNLVESSLNPSAHLCQIWRNVLWPFLRYHVHIMGQTDGWIDGRTARKKNASGRGFCWHSGMIIKAITSRSFDNLHLSGSISP